MIKIGLTGGMGVGKTTIAKMFFEQGAKVLNADLMVHELINIREDIKVKITSEYGEEILKDGSSDIIDRNKLAFKCFRQPKKLKPLLSIIYPELYKDLCMQIAKHESNNTNLFVFDAPMLLEAGLESLFDLIVLVYLPIDIQIKRLLHKGFSMEQIKARIMFQWPTWVKLRYSDYVINNSNKIEKTKVKVSRFINSL